MMHCSRVPLPLVAVALGSTACGAMRSEASGASVGKLRFRNQAIVWSVNDRRDVPETPTTNTFAQKLYFFDTFVHRRLTHAMEVHADEPARNINALGEVPNSTWFTNRVGRSELTTEQIARGPNTDDGPDLTAPIRITGTKIGGASVGLLSVDARGVKYLLKFDEPDVPEMETAADVIVARLLWALGYSVPEDQVINLRRDQLVLAETATVKDVFGNKKPMTVADLEDSLSRVHHTPDGTYRTLASKYLSGIPIGGTPQEGVREDDPNDLIPHQHLREMRAYYVFASWLQQTDVKEDNSLDMWVTDPEEPARHYVQHYLVDFGKSLGANAFIKKHPGDGHTEVPDFEFALLSTFSFGLWRRPYEGVALPGIRGVGMFDVEHYLPGAWKGHSPYLPFRFLDLQDGFWAAKTLIRLTPEQIRAAVEQGRFSDPRAVDYLTEILVARQRKAARYWFERVNPINNVELTDGGVCFEDLLLAYELTPGASATTRFDGRAFNYDGETLDWQQSRRPPSGSARVCLDGFPRGAGEERYTILNIELERAGKRFPAVEIHIADGPDGTSRVIGLNRH